MVVLIGGLALPTGVAVAAPDPPPPPVTIHPDFLPERENVTDCIGSAVQLPNCGSKGRGGWRQTAVFGAMAAGLALVFWRVSVGVRRNRGAASTGAH